MDVQIRDREHARIFFPGAGALLEMVHGRIAEGLPVAASDQHRHLGHDHDRIDLAGNGLEEQARPTLAGSERVVVWIVRIGDQRGGVVDHALGHVCVQIEGGHDGNGISHQRTNRRKQVTFRVIFSICQHRAVQREEDTVQLTHFGNASEQARSEL